MKARLILGVLLTAALAAAPGALAQEEDSEGRVVQVQTWNVEPSDAARFEAAIEKVVEAAGQAGLTRDYGWSFYNELFTYTLVYPVENMAYFDDPDQWMRQFQGTPGEETLNAAFAEFDYVSSKVVANEIAEHLTEWTYEPAGSDGDYGYAHVDEFWVKSGMDDEFGELVKEFMAFFKEIGYTYPIYGHRVRFGDSGRRVFVTVFDSKEAFYGSRSLDNLIEMKGAGEQWGGLLERFAKVITAAKHSDTEYQPHLSYWPAETQATQ